MTDSVETRALMTPEMSPRVPFEYRLIHLNIDLSDVYPKVTTGHIASAVGIDGNQVTRAFAKWGVPSESLLHEHQQVYYDHYPHYMIEFMREERAWRAWYLALPSRMNANQIAEGVGRSNGWTTKKLAELYPKVSPQRTGHKSRMYPRVAVEKLREITLSTTPDENWYSIPQLVELSGHDRDWVLNRLALTTIKPEQRRHPVIGREYTYYPPETIEALEEAVLQIPKPGGEWLTASGLERETGRSGNWVAKRLEDYLQFGELRLDDMGVERVHYPPSVLSALRQDDVELRSYENAGDWATISTMEARLGIHAITLTRLLAKIEVEDQLRLDKLGRPKQHFSPETQERLAVKAMEIYGYPEANGWLTFSVAQKTIGRSAKWIRSQFEERNVVSEVRLDRSRHPMNHYDPEIIDAIKAYGDTLDAGSMLSLSEIAERIQKSEPWTKARLRTLGFRPEKRFSKGGHFIDHYSADSIDELLSAN